MQAVCRPFSFPRAKAGSWRGLREGRVAVPCDMIAIGDYPEMNEQTGDIEGALDYLGITLPIGTVAERTWSSAIHMWSMENRPIG